MHDHFPPPFLSSNTLRETSIKPLEYIQAKRETERAERERSGSTRLGGTSTDTYKRNTATQATTDTAPTRDPPLLLRSTFNAKDPQPDPWPPYLPRRSLAMPPLRTLSLPPQMLLSRAHLLPKRRPMPHPRSPRRRRIARQRGLTELKAFEMKGKGAVR